jgi:hypothetical protein
MCYSKFNALYSHYIEKNDGWRLMMKVVNNVFPTGVAAPKVPTPEIEWNILSTGLGSWERCSNWAPRESISSPPELTGFAQRNRYLKQCLSKITIEYSDSREQPGLTYDILSEHEVS